MLRVMKLVCVHWESDKAALSVVFGMRKRVRESETRFAQSSYAVQGQRPSQRQRRERKRGVQRGAEGGERGMGKQA